jgi:hypothetical protein
MILNAPAGATAAELGGGITQDGLSNNNATVANNTNEQINNNINANAQSGNASESENTTAGNTTSGNAGTAVNLLNVENSSLSLSGWFGILFINVFGSWNGNFGIYNPLAITGGSDQTGSGSSGGGTSNSTNLAFSFVPHTSSTGSGSNHSTNTIFATGANSSNSILASQLVKHSSAAPTPRLQSKSVNLLLPAFGITVFVIYFISEYLSRRHNHSQKISQ